MSDPTYLRPLPHPTATSRPFWEGCEQGRLLYQQAEDGAAIFPPQDFAPGSLGRLKWVASSGNGAVYSFTVVCRPQTPAFDVPYIVAIVELDEGYAMLTNLVNCEPEEAHVGQRVKVRFERQNDLITLPFFEPA